MIKRNRRRSRNEQELQEGEGDAEAESIKANENTTKSHPRKLKQQTSEVLATSPPKRKSLIEHNTHPDFDESDPIITITSPPSTSHGLNSKDKGLRRKRSSLNLKNNSQGEDENANGKHEQHTDNEKEESQSVNYESENQGNIVPLSTDAETSNDEGANKQRARRNSRRFFQTSKSQEPQEPAQGPKENPKKENSQKLLQPTPVKLPDDSEGLIGVEQEPQAGPSEANLFSVKIHKTDNLKVDLHISHPVVLVHIIDKKTGEYVLKSDPSRPAVTHFENVTLEGKSANCNFLLPIMTQPFSIKRFPPQQQQQQQQQLKNSSLSPPLSSSSSSSSSPQQVDPSTSPSLSSSNALSPSSIIPLSPRQQQAKIEANSDPKKNPLHCPKWDEELLWNEAHDYLCSGKAGTVLIFEVLDFGPRLPLEMTVNGWLPIAWGFLVPSSHTIGKTVRLQLFDYPAIETYQQMPADSLKVPKVYNVYATQTHTRYPSTLYVSIRHFLPPPPSSMVPVIRPRSIFEPQLITHSFAPVCPKDDVQGDEPSGEKQEDEGIKQEKEREKAKRTTEAMEKLDPGLRRALRVRRHAKQNVFIPDSILARLDSSARGCFGLEFSSKGQYLAASCADLAMFPIKIYDIYESKCIYTYPGHHDLVYDISWSPNDDGILTASSDGTAKIWPFQNNLAIAKEKGSSAVVTLQHTCYVYAAQFFPNQDTSIRIVATGAFDNTVRLWDRDTGKVLVEGAPHKSHVNAIKFDTKGERLYSGDGSGSVAIWSCYESGNSESPIVLQCLKVVSLFGGAPINSIQIHPSGRKILIHSRNSTIHSLDARFLTPISTFTGLVNIDWPIKSTYSPCGKYVATGSENSKILLYTEDNGILAHSYMGSALGFTEPATTVAWHPSHHIIAICTFGPRAPILLLAKKNPERYKEDKPNALEAEKRSKSLQIFSSKLDLPPVTSQQDMRKTASLSLPPLITGTSPPSPEFNAPVRRPRKEITLNELDLRKGKVGNWDGDDRRGFDRDDRRERDRDRDRDDRRERERERERSNNKLGWGDDEVRKSMLSSSFGRRSSSIAPPPTEEEARKNRKKHRKARREAALTQMRKGRDDDDDEDDYDDVDEREKERGELILPPIAGKSPIERSRSKQDYIGNSPTHNNNKSPTRARGDEHFLSYNNQQKNNNNNNNNTIYNKSPSPSRVRNSPKYYNDDEDDDDVIITHHPFGT